MPKQPKAVSETNPTDQKLDAILKALTDLKEVLIKPITSQAPPDEPRPRLLPNEQGKAPEIANTIPVPSEFRQQVDSVLNSLFGVEIESSGDPLSMVFTVVCPDKYSTMTPSQREILKRDIRPKVIDRAMGINGIKEWCSIVYSSFGPEIQAQIVADRK